MRFAFFEIFNGDIFPGGIMLAIQCWQYLFRSPIGVYSMLFDFNYMKYFNEAIWP